ncbi:MAG: outer membrane protein transport protein [Planctomycetes bacterium]|nr:outer membrane protein transport protein [Planctomycetota bacterium]
MRHALSPALILLASAPLALASDGYYDLGYGVKAKGMGGAGVAFAQDSMALASNPAGLCGVGTRIDGGVTWFAPERSSTLMGTTYDGNGNDAFWIPEAGYCTKVADGVQLGIAVYGNGGMNTSYNQPIFGTTNTGIDLSQLFVAPSVSLRIAPGHSLGASVVLAYQRFEATGLQNFGIDDPGYDTSTGAGFRFGYAGDLTDWLSLGATLQSRTRMSRFEKYDTLFAEHGDFDIPANYAVGCALRPLPGTVLAFDVERILYSQVAAVGNELTMANMMSLGQDDGPGFGWRDVTVYKLGISQEIGEGLVLRAGYNHCTQPIPESQTYFNMLAPGVVQDHITCGATVALTSSLEISAFYAHAFENTVKGKGNIAPMGTPMDADLTMSQDMAGIGLGWKH